MTLAILTQYKEFKSRIKDGSITAEEIMAGSLDAHKVGGTTLLVTDEDILDRIIVAFLTKQFYILYFFNDSPLVKDITKALERVENKYFNPKILGDNRPNADYMFIPNYEITWILMKKSRISKTQLCQDLLLNQEHKDVTMKELLMRQEQLPGEDKDILPLIGDSKRELEMAQNVMFDIERYYQNFLREIGR